MARLINDIFTKEWRWVEDDPKPARQETSSRGPAGPFFMPDIAEFRSPIDGSAISSRSQLRAHEQRYGVRQCGELKSPRDFDNSSNRSRVNERALERAVGRALQRMES